MKTKVVASFPWILVVFHVVGLVLFLTDPKAAQLSYLNILLCGTLVFLSEKSLLKSFPALVVIFTLGFIVELAGTKTGFLFGDYQYGAVLGKRVYGVPLIIGVNWFAIVAASSALAARFNLSLLFKAIMAGLLAVLLDFLIEPVAIHYGFWSWKNNKIPFYNYLSWFVFAAAFSYFYLKSASGRNTTAFWLYFIWALFFAVLNLI